MNGNIGQKCARFYRKEREVLTGAKSAGDETLVPPISISAILK